MESFSDRTLTFVRHSDLDTPITLKLGSLDGTLTPNSLTELLDSPALKHAGKNQPVPSDLYVVISIWADNNELFPPFRSAHKQFKERGTAAGGGSSYVWNENITLPLKYRDLPLSSQLTVTLYDIAGPREAEVVGGSTMRFFGKKSTLKKGKQRLFMWKGVEADGRNESKTPSKVGQMGGGAKELDEMGRLEKLVKKHERGDLIRLDWLDKIAFRKIEKLHAAESIKSENLFLYIDLPRFDFPVVFVEQEYSLPIISAPSFPLPLAPAPAPVPVTTPPVSSSVMTSLFNIIDPEVARENPVEAKHRRLVRSHRNGPLDRELKPNAKIRDELNEILRYPPTQILTSPQRDLIWQFRFYLTRDKGALTKFLKSVVWSDAGEVKQAVETLLPSWAEVDMVDALELLGPGEGFRDKRVRSYAVRLMRKVDDEELMLYLLQLVQALKFEQHPSNPSQSQSPSSSIRGSRHASIRFPPPSPGMEGLTTLEEFLIERSALNPILGNFFHWYIHVEAQDKSGYGRMFAGIAKKFEKRVAEVQSQGDSDQRDFLRRQTEFVTRVSRLAKELRNSADKRPKKIDKLRSILHDSKSGLSSFPAFPLPLDARKSIVGIDAEKSSVFKSNLFPLRLHLLCEDGTEYPIIFKNGDDLRQDQLVIQLFTLMDRLLRNENLDLKILPYRVLATGSVEGMVQFVESKTLAEILGEYNGSLLGYLREFHADPGSVGTFGIRPEVLDTYIRSCAGYCVVTYLLGVGDRHLDNLLLTPDGHFFHVDFGYILGRDPKPYPPAIKLVKEMVDAMGGIGSPLHTKFKNLCFTGFTSLRKNANLIINLVALMVDANIPDIKLEPDKAVTKVQDQFLLGLSEEQAIKEFEMLLNETSYFAVVLDRVHYLAQAWRP